MLLLWDCFEDAEGSKIATYVNGWIMFLIICSAIIAVVETIPSIHKSQDKTWKAFEHFFVANFSVEFLCKVISVPSQKMFWTTGMNYVDLIAILPYYLDIAMLIATGESGALDISFLRILRLGRAFRLVKLGRYSKGVRLVTTALAKSTDALNLFLLVLMLVVVIFSSAIYYTERGEWSEFQDLYYRTDPWSGEREIFPSTFQSIPNCFWWSITTLTTVGYGDMYPYTTEGKLMATITILVGLVMLALPMAILGTNFVEERTAMLEEQLGEIPEECPEPTKIISNLEHVLKQAEVMRAIMSDLRQQTHGVREALSQLRTSNQTESKTSFLIAETEEQLELDEYGKPLPKATDLVSINKVLEFRARCLDLLGSTIVLKDNFDEYGGNGLEALPSCVRDLVLPLIQGRLHRPYILQGGDKLLIVPTSPQDNPMLLEQRSLASGHSDDMSDTSNHPTDTKENGSHTVNQQETHVVQM